MQTVSRRVYEAIGGGLAESADQLRREAARLLALADELDDAARWLGPDVAVDASAVVGAGAVVGTRAMEELAPVGAVEAPVSSGTTAAADAPDEAVAEDGPRDGRHLAVAGDVSDPANVRGVGCEDEPSTAFSRPTPVAHPWRTGEGSGSFAEVLRDGRHGLGAGPGQAWKHWETAPSAQPAWDR